MNQTKSIQTKELTGQINNMTKFMGTGENS